MGIILCVMDVQPPEWVQFRENPTEKFVEIQRITEKINSPCIACEKML